MYEWAHYLIENSEIYTRISNYIRILRAPCIVNVGIQLNNKRSYFLCSKLEIPFSFIRCIDLTAISTFALTDLFTLLFTLCIIYTNRFQLFRRRRRRHSIFSIAALCIFFFTLAQLIDSRAQLECLHKLSDSSLSIFTESSMNNYSKYIYISRIELPTLCVYRGNMKTISLATG